jgi:hypothetical protein
MAVLFGERDTVPSANDRYRPISDHGQSSESKPIRFKEKKEMVSYTVELLSPVQIRRIPACNY